MLLMAHRRNLKSRGFEPPLWGGGESQLGGILGVKSACIFEIALLLFCTLMKRLYDLIRYVVMHIHIIG